MSFGENSKTEASPTQCIYAESFVLKYGAIEQIDEQRVVSVFG